MNSDFLNGPPQHPGSDSSDPNSGSPWIKYQFAPTKVSEVAIKFGSMRVAKYPIRISVGDKVVFEGTTSANLGYWYRTFEPLQADSLKIEFTGRKGSLRITEIDIYGPVSQ